MSRSQEIATQWVGQRSKHGLEMLTNSWERRPDMHEATDQLVGGACGAFLYLELKVSYAHLS